MRPWMIALGITVLAMLATLRFAGVETTEDPEFPHSPAVLDGAPPPDPPTSEAAEPLPRTPLSPRTLPEGETDLFGRVIDHLGDPVSGAVIEILARPASPSLGNPILDDRDPQSARITSDAGGRFRFPRLSAERIFSLTVRAPGHVGARIVGVSPSNSGRVIQLLEGTTVTGVVCSPEGKPVAGARVVSNPLGSSPFGFIDRRAMDFGGPVHAEPRVFVLHSEAQTDRSGRFTLEAIPESGCSLTADHVDFGPSHAVNVSGELRGIALLVLQDPASIEGIVIDAEGSPVAAATVSLRPTGGRAIETGLDGRFRFGSLGAGDYSLGASAERVGQSASLSVEVAEGESVREVRIHLVPTAEIQGLVIDARGAPVENARVHLSTWLVDARSTVLGSIDPWQLNSFQTGVEALSDGSGQFRLITTRSTASRRSGSLGITHPDHAALWTENIEITDSEVQDVGTLQLSDGLMIEGRVVSESGAPIPGASVAIDQSAEIGEFTMRLPSPSSFRANVPASVRTDDAGEFKIGVPSPGRYPVRATAPEFEPSESVEVDLTSEESPGVVIVLYDGLTIEGLVLDAAGEACAGVPVTALHGRAPAQRTNRDGRFVLTTRGGDPVALRLGEGWSFVEPLPPIEPGDSDVQIIAAPPGRIAGHLVDRATGDPILSFRHVLSPHRSSRSSPSDRYKAIDQAPEFHSPEGRFESRPLEAGWYVLGVAAPGWTRFRDSYEVRSGETLEVTIPLDREAVVHGRILDPNGVPLQNAVVRYEIEDRWWRDRWDKTDATGWFEITALPAGPITLRFFHDAHFDFEMEPLDLREGQILDLQDVLFRRGAAVHGTVRTDDGTAFRWLRVSFDPEEGGETVYEIPQLDGSYGRGELRAGWYTVLVEYALVPASGSTSEDAPVLEHSAGRLYLEGNRDRLHDLVVPGH